MWRKSNSLALSLLYRRRLKILHDILSRSSFQSWSWGAPVCRLWTQFTFILYLNQNNNKTWKVKKTLQLLFPVWNLEDTSYSQMKISVDGDEINGTICRLKPLQELPSNVWRNMAAILFRLSPSETLRRRNDSDPIYNIVNCFEYPASGTHSK